MIAKISILINWFHGVGSTQTSIPEGRNSIMSIVTSNCTQSKYYDWTLIEGVQPIKENRKVFVFCRCKCGTERWVYDWRLINGKSKQCFSCARKSNALKRVTHGIFLISGKRTSEYSSWQNMKQRCCNQNHNSYPEYGGRGITVCDRWLNSFENFLEDMGSKPGPGYSIERLDVNGGYEPGNCIWATDYIQSRNKRNNRLITYRGETKCLTDLALDYGISVKNLSKRLDRGWDLERALLTPIAQK